MFDKNKGSAKMQCLEFLNTVYVLCNGERISGYLKMNTVKLWDDVTTIDKFNFKNVNLEPIKGSVVVPPLFYTEPYMQCLPVKKKVFFIFRKTKTMNPLINVVNSVNIGIKFRTLFFVHRSTFLIS